METKIPIKTKVPMETKVPIATKVPVATKKFKIETIAIQKRNRIEEGSKF